MSQPLVSILLTVYNGGTGLMDTLDDFAALTYRPLEVVIVDAHSTDGTWERLQQRATDFPVPLRIAQKSGGIGAGRNHAATLAEGDFFAVTDADMRVPADWIDSLMAGMDEGVGVVGGPNDGMGDDALGRATDAIPIHGPTRGEVPLRGRSRYDEDFETAGVDGDVFASVTRNCMFRREAFEQVGGFDESLLTCEDGELNFRILGAGWTIRYRRAAGVRHRHRDSIKRFWRQQLNYARGQAQANRKHPAMAKRIHAAPFAALTLWLLIVAASAVVPNLWIAATALLGIALTVAILYGVKAARWKRDGRLIVVVPFLFAVWQMAWAIGFVNGALGGARGRKHGD